MRALTLTGFDIKHNADSRSALVSVDVHSKSQGISSLQCTRDDSTFDIPLNSVILAVGSV
jgi:hypothetical protein